MKAKVTSISASAACLLIWYLAAKANLAASLSGGRPTLSGILFSLLYVLMRLYYTYISQRNIPMICFSLFPAALSALVSLFGLLFLLIDGNMGIFMLAAPLFLSPLYGIAGPIASLFPPGGRQLVLFILCCLVTIPWTLWALRLLEHSED